MPRLRRRFLAALVTSVMLAAGCGASGSGTRASGNGLVAIGAGLHGVTGTRASLYASGLDHVAAFAFDASGALWVATAAYDDTGTDAVYRIARAGATPVKVISGAHTPLGLLWYHDELYVSSHARVDAYRGFDGHAFGTRRTVVTFTDDVGENNGLVLTPDGRIQLGISAPCDSCTPTSPYSAAIVSFTPGGTNVRVDASGIRAPIALEYALGTHDLFVTMNQRDNLGAATPGDWLAVVHTGDDWGFPDCYGQKSAACATAPDPVAALDKHAAVSGLALVDGELGSHVGRAAIVAEWARGKLLKVTLAGSNGSYTGTVAPFVTGIRSPVAVTLGPDHALYAGDWATGRIYRIAAS